MKFGYTLKVQGNENQELSRHLCSLRVCDESGRIDDELSLCFVLTDTIVLPKLDDSLSVSFGPALDLIQWPSYKIRGLEVNDSIVSVRAFASEEIPGLRTTRHKNWNSSLGQIAHEIAKQANTTAIIDAKSSQQVIKTVQSESDISFLNRLAKQFGAILKINNKQIVLVTPNSGNLPRFKLKQSLPWSWKKSKTVTGVFALYWDKDESISCRVLYGEEGDTTQVQGTFANKEKAFTRARSRYFELQNNSESLRISIPCTPEFNTAKIACGCELEISTLAKFVCGVWFITRIEHMLTPEQGLVSQVECVRR